MNWKIIRWIIEALITISHQVHSCDTKLNRLLEIQGTAQDKVIHQQTKRLERGTDELKDALSHWQPQQKKEPEEDAKSNPTATS